MDQIFKALNAQLDDVKTFDLLKGQVGIYTSKNPTYSTEENNQDSSAIIPLVGNHAVLVVADGMGGHRGGDEASKTAVETVIQEVSKFTSPQERSLQDLILVAIEKAHQKIKNLGIGAGSTIAIAEINSNKELRFYNVGDSICYHVGGKGLVKYKSVEHSPVGYGVEAGFLNEEKALTHEEKNVLLNALGLDDYRIEVSCVLEVNSTDLVLLASDGLSSNMAPEEMISDLTKGKLDERLQTLVSKTHAQMQISQNTFGDPDDLSIILYRFD